MITIDMKTAIIATIIVDIGCLIVMLQLWFQHRTKYHGLGFWVADWALLTLSSLLIALRGNIPNWASMILSNSFIIGGTLLLFLGLSRFLGKKNSPFLIYVILALFAVFIFVHIYFTYINDELIVRSYNISIGLSLCCLLGMWLMFKGVSPQFLTISRGPGISFGVIVLISVARIIGFSLGSEPGNDYFSSGLFDSIMVLILAGAIMFLTFNLVLMVTRRLYLEAKQMELDLLKSQNELQATFKATTVGFAILNNRTIKEVNDSICRMMGYSRQEMIGNSTRFLYFSDGEYNQLGNIYDDIATYGMVSAELQLKRKDGEKINVITNIAALNKNDSSMEVVLTLTDITSLKKVENELKEELNIRANFINILAHELKSPLTPVMSSMGTLKELLEKNPDEILRRLSSNAYSGVELLSSRLDDLLNLARYSKGGFTINSESTDISKFIEEVTSRYRPLIEQEHHNLKVDVPTRLPEVKIDPSRMEQVLANLLTNAIKYSPLNSLIELSVQVCDDYLLIEVKDQGKGLSEIDQQSLFQPYYRLKQDRQNSFGVGLGLFICKQIVEAHGGKIQVISALGLGSTFRITLPTK